MSANEGNRKAYSQIFRSISKLDGSGQYLTEPTYHNQYKTQLGQFKTQPDQIKTCAKFRNVRFAIQ